MVPENLWLHGREKKIVKTTFVFLSFFAAAPGVFGCTDENSWERLIDVICRITTEALF